MRRRVVVTGLGLITPLGIGTEQSWKGLVEGRSGIRRITQFDASGFAAQIAGEVEGFVPEDYMDAKDARKTDRFAQLAVAAAGMALRDSGLVIGPDNAERVGVLIGSGIGGLQTIERYHAILLEKGPRRITPFFIPMLSINLAAGNISIKFGAKGPNSAVSTACATGSHAIGDACRIIQYGDADAMIAGGTEAVIAPLCIGGFSAMKALSTRNDEPQKASRPFDSGRDGFVMGEGSGILILEELQSALGRGARVLAEFAGFGMSSDAYHITSPSADGDGAARCISNALKDAGVPPGAVDYINAHGTSTRQGDEIETSAIRKVFGAHAGKLAVSSTKSMTGHLLGAAGGVEAAVSVLTIMNSIIPPTINLDNPDPECDLDYVPHEARRRRVDYALSNSFGFGGTNACLLFKRLEP
ncbi:MAG: beta-ketoacyl-ACP synthase II [Nitrospiraceae bacterium]|nr:beta-ketoacyl-ACP synthase II [Nitrospiraceae bacterium]